MSLRERAIRARREYIQNPTRALLRTYLIIQAKRGKFDRRMFRYYGVSPKVNPGCRAATVRAYAHGLVPTSTLRDGTGSYHAARNAAGEGKAVDFGLIERHIGTKYGRDKLASFQRKEHWRATKGRIHPIELIGPNNELVILRGRQTDLTEGTPLETQHDNHVHEAYAG
jgi:hypothetical protein